MVSEQRTWWSKEELRDSWELEVKGHNMGEFNFTINDVWSTIHYLNFYNKN